MQDDNRLTRYRRMFAEDAADFAQWTDGDEAQEVIVIGTVPSFLPNKVMTVVQLKGVRESYGYHIHWDGNKWYGVSRSEEVGAIQVYLAPVAAEDMTETSQQFVAYDLRAGRTVCFQIDSDRMHLIGDRLTAIKV